jgi:sugar lactone lactonase YvrE
VLKTITQGVHAPDSLAFDRAGNFYVANDPASSGKYHPSVTVYAPESTKLLRKITRGLTSACCLATDEDGDLFVGSGKEGVLEYAPGSSQILRTITDAIAGVDDMVIDTSGVLYVANWPLSQSEPGWISVFQPGSLTAEYKITTGIDQPVALALDSDGNLYAANLGPREGFVRVYGPHAKRPLRSMKSGSLGSPLAIAVGPRP